MPIISVVSFGSRSYVGLKGEEREEEIISNVKVRMRMLMVELKSLDNGRVFDLGHPLLNCLTKSLTKAAGIGDLQVVSRESYFTTVEGTGFVSKTVRVQRSVDSQISEERVAIKNGCLNKCPGYSWIKVGQSDVHKSLTVDESHENSGDVYFALEGLIMQLIDEGYVLLGNPKFSFFIRETKNTRGIT